MGYIYKITNKTDGKIYVGQTIQTLDERFRQHRKKGSNCRYLKRAFEKYGFDNFVFEMICICFDEDLDKFEIQYMAKFNSIVPNGYNLRAGGNSGRHNEETKKKISATLKGRTDIVRGNLSGFHLSEETKKKISDALKGRTDIVRGHWTGLHHSEETKKKISDALKGRTDIVKKNSKNADNIFPEELKNKNVKHHKKNVNQYDLKNNLIKTFNGIVEASKETNIGQSSISKCCNNKNITGGGFIWKFCD